MKLTPLLTKIAASLFIAAKAVKGQQCEGMPELIANLDDKYFSEIKLKWCGLNAADSTGVRAEFFRVMVEAILVADPSAAFFGTCLADVVEGMEKQEKEETSIAQGTELEGTFESRHQCDDTKTRVLTLSTVTTDSSHYVEPWSLWICKADACDTDILNEVLEAIAVDYFALGYYPFDASAIISNTSTPTTECFYDQIGDLMMNPEAYCSGKSAPVCSNKKLIELQLGTDAPFELAICDDNDCLASLNDKEGVLERLVWNYNPFCAFYVNEVTILEKEFNLSDYCSAAAASGRTGRCETSESAAWMTMESFVLKCFVGLIPLLLL